MEACGEGRFLSLSPTSGSPTFGAGDGALAPPAAMGPLAPPGAAAGEISFLPKLIRLFETLFISFTGKGSYPRYKEVVTKLGTLATVLLKQNFGTTT